MKKSLLAVAVPVALLSIGFVTPAPALSQNVLQVERRERISVPLPIINPGELLVKKEEGNIIGIIGLGEQVGNLHIKIASPIDTRVKIRYNDNNLIYSGDINKAVRLYSGRERGINFLATGETKGIIEILNEEDVVIETIEYVVKKRKSGRNSITFDSNYNSSNATTNYGVSYSHRTRTKNEFEGNWTYRVSINYSDDGDYRVSGSTSYSW